MAVTGTAARAAQMVSVLAVALAAGCGGSAPRTAAPGSPQPTAGLQSFGDAQSRWQLPVPNLADQGNDVQFTGGLMLVATTDGTMFRVTAYHEDSGTSAWSRVFPQEPVVTGNLLLAATSSASGTTLPPGKGNCAWNAISSISPASGASLWTAPVPGVAGDGCPVPTESSSYVVMGTWVLNASTGVILKELPPWPAGAAAFGGDILTEDGAALQLDTLNGGDLQPKWHQDIKGYQVAGIAYPQILLTQTGAPTDGPYRIEIVNPAAGAISGSYTTEYPFLTPEGATGASTSGHLFLLSPAALTTGPTAGGRVVLIGGILWQYPRSLRSQPTGPMDVTATDPATLKTLGSLVIQPSELTPAGSGASEYLVSDGQYAAWVGGTTIYVYKL